MKHGGIIGGVLMALCSYTTVSAAWKHSLWLTFISVTGLLFTSWGLYSSGYVEACKEYEKVVDEEEEKA
jgi:hypothetical protein